MYNRELVEDARDFARDTLSVYQYYDLADREHREDFERDLRRVLRTFRDWGLDVVLDSNPLFQLAGVLVDEDGNPLVVFNRRF